MLCACHGVVRRIDRRSDLLCLCLGLVAALTARCFTNGPVLEWITCFFERSRKPQSPGARTFELGMIKQNLVQFAEPREIISRSIERCRAIRLAKEIKVFSKRFKCFHESWHFD